jgi:hypothetical protein
MEFGRPRTFRLVTENSFSESQSRTGNLLSGLGISQYPLSSSSSGRKRKRHGETSIHAKRLRSESSRRRLDITGLIREQDDRPEKINKYSVEQPNATSLIGLVSPTDRSFDNRILSCLVISPPGRLIHEFESTKEFLKRAVILSGRLDLSIRTEKSSIVTFLRTTSLLRT